MRRPDISSDTASVGLFRNFLGGGGDDTADMIGFRRKQWLFLMLIEAVCLWNVLIMNDMFSEARKVDENKKRSITSTQKIKEKSVRKSSFDIQIVRTYFHSSHDMPVTEREKQEEGNHPKA